MEVLLREADAPETVGAVAAADRFREVGGADAALAVDAVLALEALLRANAVGRVARVVAVAAVGAAGAILRADAEGAVLAPFAAFAGVATGVCLLARGVGEQLAERVFEVGSRSRSAECRRKTQAENAPAAHDRFFSSASAPRRLPRVANVSIFVCKFSGLKKSAAANLVQCRSM